MSSPQVLSAANLNVLQGLQGIQSIRIIPKGAILFQQGSAVAGVYLIHSGEIHAMLPTGHNQKQLLGVAGAGAMLGLSESMTGENYRVTAEAGTETTAGFISRQQFLEYLRTDCDFCMEVVRVLSLELHGLYHKFRSISAHPGRPRQRPLSEQLN